VLTLRRPSDADISDFLRRADGGAFSYPSIGGTRSTPPTGYNVDHNRIRLGAGEAIFARAVAAVRRWEMFNIGWVTLCWPQTPIEPGRAVAIVVPLYGLWSLNACRIVYTIDSDRDSAANVRRFGFAYGTLADHMESGEERFTVEWRRDDDTVWYDILAFSRPRHPLAALASPLSRALQRRFARDSLEAMMRRTIHS
jgi:uncharacterized protein (UPF0548 family)